LIGGEKVAEACRQAEQAFSRRVDERALEDFYRRHARRKGTISKGNGREDGAAVPVMADAGQYLPSYFGAIPSVAGLRQDRKPSGKRHLYGIGSLVGIGENPAY